MSTYYPPGYVQYALVLDCEREGCDPKHSDDGLVILREARYGADIKTEWQTINGHAAHLMTRTTPDWQPVAKQARP